MLVEGLTGGWRCVNSMKIFIEENPSTLREWETNRRFRLTYTIEEKTRRPISLGLGESTKISQRELVARSRCPRCGGAFWDLVHSPFYECQWCHKQRLMQEREFVPKLPQ